MKKKTAFKRSFKLISCLLFLVLVGGMVSEIYLRAARRFSSDALEAYRSRNVFYQARSVTEASDEALWETKWKSYRPGAQREFIVGGETYLVKINSQGFRTSEIGAEKPRGQVRIACLGASTTVQGRTNESTYPALLEQKLAARFPGLDVKVMNLGVSGTDSHHWVEKFETLTGFGPDMVIQYNAMNDIAFRYMYLFATRHPGKRMLNGSLLVQKLLPVDPREFDPYFGATLDNYRKLSRMCAARRIRYVAASFAVPSYEDASKDFRRFLDADVSQSWGFYLNLKYYRPLEALVQRCNELLEAFARQEGIAFVAVHKQLYDPALYTDSCHMTQAGIDRLAEAFVPVTSRWIETSYGQRLEE